MKFVPLLMVAGLVLPFLVPASSVATDAPTEVVENLHTTLLAVMKYAERLGYTGRYDRPAPVIMATFDLPFIATIVVGRYWRTFSDEEKAKFVETFNRLTIATYAGRFDGYSGERFAVVSTKELRNNHILKYHGYDKYFPLWALARYRNLRRRGAV